MRILFVVDYYQPKLGYGSFFIPRELARLGHKVTIFTSDHFYPFPNYKETTGKILGPRKVKAGKSLENGVVIIRKVMITEIFTRAVFFGHENIISKLKPDVVIVDKTAGYSAIVVSLLRKKYHYKLISVDAHLPSGFKAEGNQLVKEIFYFIFRLLFTSLINRTTDKFIAVQEATEDVMRIFYGIKNKIVHIPLGTDLEVNKKDIKAGRMIRKKYDISKNQFVVIYTGKIIKEKGVDILIKALDILCKKYNDIVILLVGDGPSEYRKFCLNKLNKKYHKKVIWAGFQPALELYQYYSAADIAVWPLQESMAMNDAASCSLPFIANHTIGARLRLSNNNALIYKKGDEKDLAKKIELLYRNPKVRIKMGKQGRELMENKLSWSKIAKEYISVN